ncbi:MAG: hypothetical protein M5U20_04460 [Phycisphaerales bacterium]|nr:hypothetical protein [Phycisphaerales bacterium]
MSVVHAARADGVLGVDEAEVGVVVPRAGSGDGIKEAAGVVGLRADEFLIGGLVRGLDVEVSAEDEVAVYGEGLGVGADGLGFEEASLLILAGGACLHVGGVEGDDGRVGLVADGAHVVAVHVARVVRGGAALGDDDRVEEVKFRGTVDEGVVGIVAVDEGGHRPVAW